MLLLLVIGVLATSQVRRDSQTKIQSPTPTLPYDFSYTPAPPDLSEFELKSTPNLELTKEWKTYKNSEFDFEIKYPPSWKVFNNGQDYLVVFSMGDNEKAWVEIKHPIKSSKNVEDWFEEGKNVTPKEILSTEVINDSVFKKRFGCSRICETEYFIKKGDYILSFAFRTHYYKETKDEVEQTLVNMKHTLKFTE